MNFIKKIKISNFFSIKNEIEIEFTATEYTAKKHPERVVQYKKRFYNKLITFYGANASGKTSILKALVWFSKVISNRNEEFPLAYKNIYNTPETPSFIEINFILNDREFFYKISFDANKNNFLTGINNEIFRIVLDGKPRVLFNRKKEVFKNLDLTPIAGLLFDKFSFKNSLLFAAESRTEDYNDVFKFFESISRYTNIQGANHIKFNIDSMDRFLMSFPFLDDNSLDSITSEKFLEHLKADKNIHTKKVFNNVNSHWKKFIVKNLQMLGIDICNASASINDVDLKGSNDANGTISIDLDFNTYHTIDDKKALDFFLESSGTKMIMLLLANIYRADIEGCVIVLDELDSVIHPMLVPILNYITLKLDVQFIYSSHNIHNMKYLYSDEIFLIEKDLNHNTTIKNLKEYDGFENFAKLYENKLLGGIPKLQENLSI